MESKLLDRLFSRVDKNSSSSWNGTKCHEWKGYTMKSGYGQINDCGKVRYVHVLAYEAAKGPTPKGLQILHQCNHRHCVNPEHMTTGTVQRKMDALVARRGHAHGPKSFHAKLTVAQVHEIRKSRDKQQDIADHYGVTNSNVSVIKAGKTWQYV